MGLLVNSKNLAVVLGRVVPGRARAGVAVRCFQVEERGFLGTADALQQRGREVGRVHGAVLCVFVFLLGLFVEAQVVVEGLVRVDQVVDVRRSDEGNLHADLLFGIVGLARLAESAFVDAAVQEFVEILLF